MSKLAAAFFWRKLDQPGYDDCRLLAIAGGWRLSGAAVFRHGRRACHFRYDVSADAAFRTRSAHVCGWLGNNAITMEAKATGNGRWRVLGVPSAGIAGCIDVDLGFTPATNLLVLRRLALKVGQHAQAPAAWLELPGMRITRLPQRYERIARNQYAYEAPSVGYRGILTVSPLGAVIRYPGLFEMVVARKPGQ
jgi:uncharacterized protein